MTTTSAEHETEPSPAIYGVAKHETDPSPAGSATDPSLAKCDMQACDAFKQSWRAKNWRYDTAHIPACNGCPREVFGVWP
eukprot:7726127-Pyramimonas_sp.AAC.1